VPQRSRRVVVLAHCILNANAKYVGGAACSGADLTAIEPYLREGAGIVQLPCPESGLLGISRWAMTRNQLDTAGYRRHCRDILRPTLDTLEEFAAAGYEIEGVVGIKGSPSCGVTETSEGYSGGKVGGAHAHSRVGGAGVMMAVLTEMLAERGLNVELRDADNPD
jgi:predicted secreted protein